MGFILRRQVITMCLQAALVHLVASAALRHALRMQRPLGTKEPKKQGCRRILASPLAAPGCDSQTDEQTERTNTNDLMTLPVSLMRPNDAQHLQTIKQQLHALTGSELSHERVLVS